MTYAQVKAYIDEFIVTNGNQEITAAVLNPVLQSMIDMVLEITGDKSNLSTNNKNTLVEAINEVYTAIGSIGNNSPHVYQGEDDPNTTPPPIFTIGDFYIQTDPFNEPIALFLYDGVMWQNLTNNVYNRRVKIISATSPYTLVQEDVQNFLTLTTEYDIVLPLDLEDSTEFWIKNVSGSTREVTFDVNIVFNGSPLIPNNGLCILKKLYSSGVVENWSINVIKENEILNPRVQNVTSSATVTPTHTNDIVTITAQATGLTLANPTGAFAEGQSLMIRIKDDGTARSITFGSNYRAIGITLPTTTVISKTLYLGIIYNDTDSKWDILGINQES